MNINMQRVHELLNNTPHNAEYVKYWQELQPVKEQVLAHSGACQAIDERGYVGLHMAALHFVHGVALSEMGTYLQL